VLFGLVIGVEKLWVGRSEDDVIVVCVVCCL
jgi:hypothetical protein